MKRLIPDSIAARTLAVLILGLAFSHIISVALYISDRTGGPTFSGGEPIGTRIATIERVITSATEAERPRLVEIADAPRLHVTLTPKSAVEARPPGNLPPGGLGEALTAQLNPANLPALRLQKTSLPAVDLLHGPAPPGTVEESMAEAMMVSVPLPGGSWLNFAVPVEAPKPFWSLRFVLSMAVMLLAVAIFSGLVVHHFTKPLATFAAAAQRLGVDVNAPPLPEGGPAEVRLATRAFNEMQGRIRRFVEDRTQMIAAISHDLGTPITRMRLRAEFVEDEEQRSKMLADLDDMEKMVFSALSFARDEADREPHARVDLRTLLQRVCDDAGDAGHPVALEVGNAAVPYSCRPVALRRALSNLINNAVGYGHRARVSLIQEAEATGALLVTIDDDGPGIPPDRQEDVFKPFFRLESSRSRETGGTGLGLTVARTIIRAHGGDMALSNRDEGGLRVTVRLPR
ncbi:hypothetical protein MNBD_ALPHA09-1710 [hydrothermal vent metagenome]|uniref:histidine kinase n=1 Tax=hydrothermal vent metagenome TaxID=652676 RepID=A0A3B0TVD5_9ZZZZ